MPRQFTDEEIVATIKTLAAEGAALTRASVRDRLGGGGSTRISALLKTHGDATREQSTGRSGPATVRSPKSGPTRSGPATGRTRSATDATATMVEVASPEASLVPSSVPEGSMPGLRSEIRVLKILLEEERTARREDEARHRRTIEALQAEIGNANRART